ncbi:MAG: YggT family protein [Aestuariivirga sp.]|uniref:YggT family protein n=1 Tax=Aestuariivirga sp. TaxID=2650926 RepID=UPI0025BA9AAF|nr:YggT family protein [Aestuariivirga sp.]MCA3560171.1 YggT family protein [Aestuariivirga sp.]
MSSILWLIMTILQLYIYVIIAMVVMSWLVAFGIVNRSNPYVRQFGHVLDRLTEPVFRPIRRILPDLGGLDVSPVIVLLGILFLQRFIPELFMSVFTP